MLKANLSRSTRMVAPLVGAAALLLSACTSGGSDDGSGSVANNAGGSHSKAVSDPATHTKPAKPPKPVHISTLNADGAQYGVGMPVIAYFSRKIKSGKALQDATKVTVDGKPLDGGWYFEYSAHKGSPIEAHWRPEHYWPPNSRVHVDIPAKGLSAGGRMAYDDSLTLDFYIGDSHIGTVNDATHRLTIKNNGHHWGTFPVSLGATSTPTRHGTKVIMEKRPSVCMHDIAGTYYECGIKLDQRLTYDGEYLHSAPWNVNNIGHTDTSNGCTNLLPDDAKKLYHFLEIGDVIEYPNANGKAMQLGDGYGDWNVLWSTWQTGGLISTTA